jgi:hypothetical protein
MKEESFRGFTAVPPVFACCRLCRKAVLAAGLPVRVCGFLIATSRC